MSPPTNETTTTTMAWKNRLLMLLVVMSVGAGLAMAAAFVAPEGEFTTQGTFSIVFVGTSLVSVYTILRSGVKTHPMQFRLALLSREVWLAGLRALRWSEFDRRQKREIVSLAVTSAMINFGGPLAVQYLGNGLAAGIQTCGSLAVGLLAMRLLQHWLARSIAFVAVLMAALNGSGGDINMIGLVAALGPAIHMWNLPKRVVSLRPKQHEGLALANIISAPFVLPGTILWDTSRGVSWAWGWKEIVAALCAGVLVMAIPVFLQNFAADRGMPDSEQGAMAALSSPVHAAVGFVLSPVTRFFTGTDPLLPTMEQVAFFVILAMSALLAAVLPKGPTPKEIRLSEELDAARKLMAALESDREAVAKKLEESRRRSYIAALALAHKFRVAEVAAMLDNGLSEELVARVAAKRIKPFLVIWLCQMGYDPVTAVDTASKLPKHRTKQWFKRVFEEELPQVLDGRKPVDELTRDEQDTIRFLLGYVVPTAGRGLELALSQSGRKLDYEGVRLP